MAGGRRFEAPIPSEPLVFDGGVVPEAWLDFNDHMNVGYYALAFDRALEPWYEDWVDLGASYVARSGMGPFALQSHIHYLRELRRGDRYDITVLFLDCDHKRWRFFMTLRNLGTGDIAATCEQISMNVDLSARRSAPLPAPQAARLEAFRRAHASSPRPPQIGAPLGIRRTEA